jgi:thiamine-phosphate pyrophosphorylase
MSVPNVRRFDIPSVAGTIATPIVFCSLKKMFAFPAKLYPLTDRKISQLSHLDQVQQLIRGGARMIQLREKHLDPREFYNEAADCMRLARARGVRIIINDHAGIALALGADGVHLGQDDLPPAAARRLLGPDAIIGFSTHNVEQAQHAAQQPVDYIAIGPIFATSSKVDPEPVVGLDGLSRVREVTGSIPLVAIGGIGLENAAAAISAGADAIASIGGLLGLTASIEARTRQLLDWL